MRGQFLFASTAFVVMLILPMIGFSVETEDARSAGCLPREVPETALLACASCHKDAPIRLGTNRDKLCTTYCMSCHKNAEMDRHHTVGTELPKMPDNMLHLTSENKVACSTCHDLSRARYDTVRWKATSLFDRLFRSEIRYKTYFLAMRNDAGQLCLTCH